MLLRAPLNQQRRQRRFVSLVSGVNLGLFVLILSGLILALSTSAVYASDSQIPVAESANQESPNQELAKPEALASDADSIQERDYLLGDLGRASWSEQGYRLDILAINDLFANTTGGNQRGGGIMGSLNVILTIDTETAGWWDDGELVLYGVGIYGRRPSKVVGDYQWTDSFEGLDTVEPYQAYYQHAFADGRVKLLAGIVDYTLEFAVANYSFAFINSSFWTPSTITQIPYSFWPNTGLGARILAKPSDDTYLLAGVYDAKPTDFNRVRAVDLELSARDGAYSIGEVGFETADEKTFIPSLALERGTVQVSSLTRWVKSKIQILAPILWANESCGVRQKEATRGSVRSFILAQQRKIETSTQSMLAAEFVTKGSLKNETKMFSEPGLQLQRRARAIALLRLKLIQLSRRLSCSIAFRWCPALR
jgi:carbohydrate-selective porin OprB